MLIRLISILLLLQSRGRMTAGELSEQLEVSERTIYRDLDALSMSGVPVYSEHGPGGGYTLLDSYRTTLTGLNEAEVRTLFMSGVSGPSGRSWAGRGAGNCPAQTVGLATGIAAKTRRTDAPADSPGCHRLVSVARISTASPDHSGRRVARPESHHCLPAQRRRRSANVSLPPTAWSRRPASGTWSLPSATTCASIVPHAFSRPACSMNNLNTQPILIWSPTGRRGAATL